MYSTPKPMTGRPALESNNLLPPLCVKKIFKHASNLVIAQAYAHNID